jgi:hypothetical protein
MKVISLTDAASLLKTVKAERASFFFSVKFIKRTTGEVRDMECRVDVKKFLKGGPPAYNPNDYNLVWVADVALIREIAQAKRNGTYAGETPYRSINLDTVLEIRIDGEHYKISKPLVMSKKLGSLMNYLQKVRG